MTFVTVQSSIHGNHVDVPFASTDNLALARLLAAAISAEVAHREATIAFSHNGPPPEVRGDDGGVFFQDTDGFTRLPGGYDAVVNLANDATIMGSCGDAESVLSGDGNLKFVVSDGAGTVVAGGGNNDMEIARDDRGAWLIALGGGNDTIAALGNGNDTIRAGAGHNLITLGGGKDSLLLTGQDTVTASRGRDTIDASGAKSTLLYGGGASVIFYGGAGAATILGGWGSDTVYGGSGRLSVQGGSAGDNLLFAGTGMATLFGGGSGDRLYAQGHQAQALFAGAGNETLSAAQSSGSVSLVGGSGKTTMDGGSGADVFAFIKGKAGGQDLIVNFDSADKVLLSGYGPNAVAGVLATQSVLHGSVSITLSDNTKITFAGIASLKSSDFA